MLTVSRNAQKSTMKVETDDTLATARTTQREALKVAGDSNLPGQQSPCRTVLGQEPKSENGQFAGSFSNLGEWCWPWIGRGLIVEVLDVTILAVVHL
jgi:hypothetical protein